MNILQNLKAVLRTLPKIIPDTVPNQYVKCVHSSCLKLFPERKEEGRVLQVLCPDSLVVVC